jgi:hypothetical protein
MGVDAIYHIVWILEIVTMTNQSQHLGKDLGSPGKCFSLLYLSRAQVAIKLSRHIQFFCLSLAYPKSKGHLKEHTSFLFTPKPFIIRSHLVCYKFQSSICDDFNLVGSVGLIIRAEILETIAQSTRIR